MAQVSGSHLICRALKLEGVKNIFGLAGDPILPLLDVMSDQDFRIIDTRHEQGRRAYGRRLGAAHRTVGRLPVHDSRLCQCHLRVDQCAAHRRAAVLSR